jgi:hypothetical protein
MLMKFIEKLDYVLICLFAVASFRHSPSDIVLSTVSLMFIIELFVSIKLVFDANERIINCNYLIYV